MRVISGVHWVTLRLWGDMSRFWGLGFRGFMFISNLANRPRNLAGTKEMESESGGLSTGSDLTLDGSRSHNYVKQGLLAAN